MISRTDIRHLERCIELAAEALASGNDPFGSVLVGADGTVLFEDHNRVAGGDATSHPEFEIVRWATKNMSAEDRASATVYTSGEHCPMCSAAHGWAGLGRIVYASSARQTAAWMAELGVPPSPVRPLAIADVIRGVEVEGPVPELAEQARELHRRAHLG